MIPLGVDLQPYLRSKQYTRSGNCIRGGLISKEVADRFVEALRKVEEGRDVEALVEIHTENLLGTTAYASKPLHERRI